MQELIWIIAVYFTYKLGRVMESDAWRYGGKRTGIDIWPRHLPYYDDEHHG
jgi:hypothetical protein